MDTLKVLVENKLSEETQRKDNFGKRGGKSAVTDVSFILDSTEQRNKNINIY